MGYNITSMIEIQSAKILLLPPKYEKIMFLLISLCESNIGLFSVAPCIVIAFNLFSIIFCISSLLLFWLLSLYITLPTIVISIVVAFSHYFSLSPARKRNIWGAIQKRSHEMYKPIQKNSIDLIVGGAITKWGAIECNKYYFAGCQTSLR